MGDLERQFREYLEPRRRAFRLPESEVREWVAGGADWSERRQRLRFWVQRRGSSSGSEFCSPPDLVDFVGRVAATVMSNAASVLDPVCGSGLLLGDVAEAVGASVVHGVDIFPSMCELARLLLPDHAEVWHGDVLADGIPLQADYDLIVAEPPFGVLLEDGWVLPHSKGFMVSHLSNAVAWWASLRLSPNGTAIMLLPSSFLVKRAKRAWQMLEQQGVFVRACIHVPCSSLQGRQVEAYAVIVDRVKRETVFVGQFTPDEGHQLQLLENLAKHRHARLAAQGRLCGWPVFAGFAVIEAREQVRALGKRMGLAPIPMREVVTEYHLAQSLDYKPMETKPNTVYLPTLHRGGAVVEPSALPPGSRPHLELQLDTQKADARYVAGILNQDIGQAVLDGVRGGSGAGGISPARLMEMDLHLPDLETQRRTADAVAEVHRQHAKLDQLKSDLWSLPGQIEQTAERIACFRDEDRFEDWLDALPFPLASILWRHHASSGSPHERAEILLKFFEGLAQFLATVHLSAWVRDQDLWAQHSPELYHILEDQHLTFERATFGLWKCIVEYLSAQARKMGSDSLEGCFAVYRTRSRRVLDMLCHPGLQAVLQSANTLRNRRAHGGLVSARHAEGLHHDLSKLVEVCRAAIGRIWVEYELVQPAECRIRDGVYSYRARRIMGTRTPFEAVSLECIEALEDGSLYLMQPEGDRGLMLLPFVRVMASPKTEANACYFYNRSDDATARYVSYHFDAEPEVEGHFDDTTTALARLRSTALGPEPRDHGR